MSATGEDIAVKYSIELDLTNLEALEEAAKRIQEAKSQATGDGGTVVDTGASDTNEKKNFLKSLFEAEGIDSSKLTEFFGIVKNPQAWMVGTLRALPVIGGIFVIKELAEFIWEWLTDYGRPLDTHFRRLLSEEAIKTRSRQEREEIRLGLKQVIFTHDSGSTRPDQAFNSLSQYREGTINEMDIYRIRSGRLGT